MNVLQILNIAKKKNNAIRKVPIAAVFFYYLFFSSINLNANQLKIFLLPTYDKFTSTLKSLQADSITGTDFAIFIKDKSTIAITNVISDTSLKDNRIVSLREGKDRVYLYLELKDYDSRISIMVYNMLGKKVLDVFDGVPKFKNSDMPYEIEVSGLPNGVYLCTIVGRGFRLNGKFIISR